MKSFKLHITLFLLVSLKLFALTEIEVQKEANHQETPLVSTPYQTTPKVDVVTGGYFENEIDLSIAGVEPLSARRFYYHLAPYEPRYGDWHYNPECYAAGNFEIGTLPIFISVGNREGTIHCFEKRTHDLKNDVTGEFSFDLQKQKGCVALNGQTHPLNTTVSFRRPYAEVFAYEGEIVDGDGTKRLFHTPSHSWLDEVKVEFETEVYFNHTRKRMQGKLGVLPPAWTPFQLLIHEEKLPNGNILEYTYTKWSDEPICPRFRLLEKITAYNSTKSKILGTLTFAYHRKGEEIHGMIVTGSDGRTAHFAHGAKNRLLNGVSSPDSPPTNYDYQGHQLTCVIKPRGLALLTAYTASNQVSAQYAHVGPNGELSPIAQYQYHPNATEVIDAEGGKKVYRYDENKRITAIETYTQEGLYRIDRNEWSTEGNLLSKIVEDANGKIFLKHQYTYDSHHNPIKEVIDEDSVTRTYTTDGFNLVKTEVYPSGKRIVYSYVPNTNLLSSELVYHNKKLCKRTFHFYHSELQSFRVKTIIDDGIGTDPKDLVYLTERHIIEYKPKLESPCLGLPEEVLEKTIDASGQEVLLKRICYHYHSSGKVEKEEHYDANNQFCYCIENEYDRNERLNATTDALGHRTIFDYDPNFNLTLEKGPHKEISWTYDLANRPIQIRQEGTLTQKKYDKASRLIAVIDASNQETNYTYDALGRLIAIHRPDGAVERREYDLLGNIINEIDGNGYETKKTYNFRGQPLTITHPDGSQESFSYHPQGNLATHTDTNRTKTVYTYDIFDHPIKIEVFSPSGKLLKRTTAIYSAFHKLSETDASGIVTTYNYDFAGRQIQEKTKERIINYTYDALGRLSSLQKGDSHTHFDYDLSDQLIEKRIENARGDLNFQEKYTYDPNGQREATVTCAGVDTTLYNSFGEPVKRIDPLGRESEIFYHYTPYTKTIRNPLGVVTIETHDSCGHLAQIEVKDPRGNILQKREKIYDGAGNQIQVIEHKYLGTQFHSTITHEWSYGPRNRIERFLEAGEKETRYLYDHAGRLQTTIKPDQTELHREYDDLGRLKRYFGIDFDYRYAYDTDDHVTSVYDQASKTTTTRYYDAYGNLTQEVLANGITLKSSYDPYGHRLSLKLPDSSTITYTYDADFLHSVSRKGLTHTYAERNLSGKPLRVVMPNRLGEINYTWDPALRYQCISSPYFNADYTYDEIGNLIEYRFQDSLGEEKCTYTYDGLSQLLSEKSHTYAYDSLYNRTRKDEDAYTLNALSQLLEDGRQSYRYDLNGNLIQDGKRSYLYDSLDRLIAVTEKGTKTQYTYDPFNRRLTKNGHKFIWDGQNEIGLSDWVLKELRVLGEGPGEMDALHFELKGCIYIPIHDHRGSLVTIVNSNGKISDTCRYTAFGEELTKTTQAPWRFSSKRHDPETELIYFGRRYYNPSLGRWTTPDPHGFQDGPNLYAYLRNCPLTDFDLYGLWSWRNAFNTFDTGLQAAFPLTYRYAQRNNYLMGVPAAIFELGTWMVGAEGASLAGKTVSQVTRGALQRQASRQATAKTAALTERHIARRAVSEKNLGRFHQAASQLSEAGQNNIRILRNWAKSKGWVKEPNPLGKPERWGTYQDNKFAWRLRIKPESSSRYGLESASNAPRFDARFKFEQEFKYMNPFTGEIGNYREMSHLPLEGLYY